MSKDRLSSFRQQAQVSLTELERNQTTRNNIEQAFANEQQNRINLQQATEQNTAARHQQTALVSQLNQANSELHNAQARYQQAESTAQQLSAERSYLNNELQSQRSLFSSITSLLNQYRKFEGIELFPAIVMTQKLDPEELARTDVLKVTCKEQCKDAFDKALAKITNINFQDLDGKTILMHAIINGFYYGVDKLLQKGADVNLLDNQGNNALIYCAQIPHIKYFKQIAEKTLDINYTSPDLHSNTVFHELIINTGNYLFVSEVFQEMNYTSILNTTAKRIIAELEGAVIGGIMLGKRADGYTIEQEKTLHIIKYLVEKKNININVQNDEGHTPLFLAAKNLFFDVVDLLFNKYHALDLVDKVGYAAWDIAVYNSQQNLIDIFLPKKTINSEVVKLWCAARKGELNIVEQQINKGIDTNSAIGDIFDTTPLIQSIALSHFPVVSALITAGANINKADKSEASPLYYSLGYAGQPIQPTIVKYLISNGANINQPMNDGDTPLHMSCYSACVGAIKLLLEHGAGINTANHQGKTPLHVLIEKKEITKDQKITSVKYLLCKAASPTLKDNTGIDIIESARHNFPEALPWLEHPEVLPSLQEFESSITGLIHDFII